MGRGGFPPSKTGSFSAHHTAPWVGLLSQVPGIRSQEDLLPITSRQFAGSPKHIG